MNVFQTISTWVGTALLAVITSSVAGESAPYLNISKVEVETKGKGSDKTLELEIKTASAIPVDGKSGAFGYAALTDNGNNLMVAVTHLPIDDSSHEDPINGFHTHVLDLKEPTEACKGASFEVDLENSGKNSAFDADYRWKVEGNELSVKNIPVSDVGDSGVEAVVSFTLKPILGTDKKPTNLCVTVVDKA